MRDGRLLALARLARPDASGVALDFSLTMLAAARTRFAEDTMVSEVKHDMSEPLPDLGRFDVVLSSFAIHHLSDGCKLALYRVIFRLLQPGGLSCNLEHVASPSDALHEAFYRALGQSVADEDPSNRCIDMGTQLEWLRSIGFEDVDCFWKWRELALLAGWRPR
jgi:ubiquinone/menaquinone biosynthesis C-methylase UbiE